VIAEPTLAKSVAAAVNMSGAVIRNDIWHLSIRHDKHAMPTRVVVVPTSTGRP
jgi:hypothetical protein